MQQSKAAKRYAKALLEISVEKQQETILFNEITSFLKATETSSELAPILASPIVKTEIKQQILTEIFTDKSILLQQLISVLAQNKRIQLLLEIFNSFVTQYNQLKNQQIAVVTTAIPISDDLQKIILQRVKEITKNENISIENKIDSSIIGGFILRIGDSQYNASILNKLNYLKQQLSVS